MYHRIVAPLTYCHHVSSSLRYLSFWHKYKGEKSFSSTQYLQSVVVSLKFEDSYRNTGSFRTCLTILPVLRRADFSSQCTSALPEIWASYWVLFCVTALIAPTTIEKTMTAVSQIISNFSHKPVFIDHLCCIEFNDEVLRYSHIDYGGIPRISSITSMSGWLAITCMGMHR